MPTPVPIPPTRQPKLHFLLPAHSSNRDLCGCLRTHLINGFQPLLVNFGHDAGGDRENKYYKLIGVHNFLQNATANDLQPGDVIAIVDGFDLWSQLSATMLIDRFLASGKRIVLGLDKQCFPNDPRSPICNDIPESPLPTDVFGSRTDKDPIQGPRDRTRPRWVNSGTVVGYFEDLQQLYVSMIAYCGPDNDEKSDQRIFAVHYYWGNFSLSLDFDAQIVTSFAFSVNELDYLTDVEDLTGRGIGPWTGIILEGAFEIPRVPVVHYTTLDTVPVFLHFPGVAKRVMNGWHQRMWWTVNENRSQMLNDFVMDKEIKVVDSGERLNFWEGFILGAHGAVARTTGKVPRESLMCRLNFGREVISGIHVIETTSTKFQTAGRALPENFRGN
ncbi:hypothetical protein EV426DRAFT_639386 [Tirmania nivea]|nr:hypothetical protein EV426DRAFT_639386 [Tirmania nivea]